MTKTALLLLALVACGDNLNSPTSPDAGLAVAVDAQTDAPRKRQGDCLVSNLPFDRDVTLVDGDPLPPAVINALQDMHKGDRRARFTRQSLPTCWVATGTAPTLVANPQAGGPVLPVWLIPTAQTVYTWIPYEPGDTIENFFLDVYGDGVADWIMNAAYVSDLTAGATVTAIASTGGSVNNLPASWTRVNIATLGLGGGVIPTQLGIGYLRMSLIVSNGTQIHLGDVFSSSYR